MATVTFTPPDHEFAASSGSNVNFDQSWSYFDHPPNSTSNLTITSNEGDPDPYTFELGETYDLTWQGNGGGSMEDATIIRSDDWGNDQGVIVFEGINSATGELYQLVWSPNYDLESWYWSNGGGPSSPNAFWTSDQTATTYSAANCFAFGTLIATASGLRKVETIAPDTLVETLDHGLQPVKWRQFARQDLRAGSDGGSEGAWPVHIRAGALGADRPSQDMTLSAQHRVLVGGQDQLCDLFPEEVLVPAKALLGLPGITALRHAAHVD